MNNMHKMMEKLMMTNKKMVLDRLAEDVNAQSKKIDTMTEAFTMKVQEFEIRTTSASRRWRATPTRRCRSKRPT